MEKVNLHQAFDALDAFWSQTTLGEANGTLLKVAKGTGRTNWHRHDDQDEVFVVYHGTLLVHTHTETIHLMEGDLLVVPCGTEHATEAPDEAHFLILGRSVTSTPDGGKPAWSATESPPPPLHEDTAK